MTDNENPTPEAESEVVDTGTDADTANDDLAEGEEVIVDALTGEVTTITAEEAAAEEAAEQAAAAVALMDIPEGISPELFYDPYGEEILSTSKADFASQCASDAALELESARPLWPEPSRYLVFPVLLRKISSPLSKSLQNL